MEINEIIKKYKQKDNIDDDYSSTEDIAEFIGEIVGPQSNNPRDKVIDGLDDINGIVEKMINKPEWATKIRLATRALMYTYQMSTGEQMKMEEKRLFGILLAFLYALQKDKIIKFLW
jgi:hypothetical protein